MYSRMFYIDVIIFAVVMAFLGLIILGGLNPTDDGTPGQVTMAR